MRSRALGSTTLLISLASLAVAAATANCSSSSTGGNGSTSSGSADAGDAGSSHDGGDAGVGHDGGDAGRAGDAGDASVGTPDGEAGAPDAASDTGAWNGDGGDAGDAGVNDPAAAFTTKTPIKHLVVIFGENISFDHYFGTYPNAVADGGGPAFTAAAGTPKANNLVTPLDPTKNFAPINGVDLLASNPTASNTANGDAGVNPFWLGPAQAATSDMGHNYKPEQQASNGGAMDLFPLYTGTAGPPPDAGPLAVFTKGLVMAYYDSNTVGEMWTLAQNYALADNAWTTNFGPSTPGAINLISGQTNGIVQPNHLPLSASHAVSDGAGGLTMIGDTDPLNDVCSSAADQNLMAGRNIGDLLNTKKISWGWFEGGFDRTITNANGTTDCQRSTAPTAPGASTSTDYIPHHQPFQYYASTANPTHARPSSVKTIGGSVGADGGVDPANHQYDSHDFFDALAAGNFPAVSYLKAPAYQDGHPGYSDPIDEMAFVTQVVNAVKASPFWDSTAIVITYDDSDGWYDHQAPPIVNPSTSFADALNGNDGGVGSCTTANAQQGDGGAAPSTPLLGAPPADGGAPVPVQGRCGYGTRVPLLVISSHAKKNYIDHTLLDQTSVLRFVEDNWLNGERIQPGGSFDTIANPIDGMFSF